MNPDTNTQGQGWRHAATEPREPNWIGPRAFGARYGHDDDLDFGMRWGPRHEQRIHLRPGHGGDHGLLYAYDPTWDEYAVLAFDAPVAAVEAAYAQALEVDTHMHVLTFAELVRCHQILASSPPDSPNAARVIEP